MSIWVDIIKHYNYFGLSIPGTSVKDELVLAFPITYISVFYDSLIPLSVSKHIKGEIDRFNFSDYREAGYDDNGLDLMYQNNGNYDLVIKNAYVDVKPFRLKVYHNDMIYLPNMKFINCVVNRYNFLNNNQYISDENCVYNWI